MAASPVLIHSASQTNNSASYTTASITPVSGEATTIHVITSATLNAPTITGTGGWNVTWTKRAEHTYRSDDNARMTIYEGVPSSGTAGTLTFDLGADGASHIFYHIVRHPDGDTGAPNIVVETAFTKADVSNGATATLTGVDAPNYVMGHAGSSSSNDLVPGTGFIEIDELAEAESTHSMVMWQDAQDTTVDFDHDPDTTSGDVGILGIEIAVVSAAADPPTGFQLGEGLDDENIPLEWTNSGDEDDGLDIERAPDVSGSPGTYAALTASPLATGTTSHNDQQSIAGDTSYWHRIRTRSTTLDPSEWVELGPTLTAPDRPTGLTEDAVGQTTIDISWTDQTGATHTHRVYYREQGESIWLRSGGNVQAGTTIHQITGLEPGTIYEWTVAAYNNTDDLESGFPAFVTSTSGGGISGSGSPSLPGFTVSSAGTVLITGSGSPTLPGLTSTGVAEPPEPPAPPAKFTWSSLSGVPRELELLVPLRFREGSYGHLRSRYRAVGLDQRTIATEIVPGGAEVVSAMVRFAGNPTRLRQMLQDTADGQTIIYVAQDVHPALPEYEGETGDGGNLLADPEAFDGAAWTAAATVTPDDAVAPDGTLSADKLEDTSGAGQEGASQGVSVVDGDALVASIFVKKVTTYSVTYNLQISFTGGSLKFARVFLNPETGAIAGSNDPDDFGVEDVGDYWRLWLKLTNNASGNTNASFVQRMAVNTNPAPGTNFEDAATGFQHLWGAQLVNLGPQVPVRIDYAGPLVRISPDRDRFGLGEWETEVRMRRVDGGTLAGLFPHDI